MPVVVGLAAAAAYLNNLSSGFVYDDAVQVVQNSWITSPSNLPAIFSSGVWGFNDMPTNYYRPMMHVLYMAVYMASGLQPLAFHSMNVILHALASMLLFGVVRKLMRGSPPEGGADHSMPALFAGLLFALHPIHTEAVSWIAGLPDLAMALFGMSSFYFYIRSDSTGPSNSLRDRMISVVFFLLAALSKEPALLLPVIMLAYDHSFSSIPKNARGLIERYGPYAAAGLLYTGARWSALGGFAPNTAKDALGVYGSILNGVYLMGMYLEKLALPFNLNAYHSFTPVASLAEPRWIVSAAIVSILAGASVFSLAGRRRVFFGIVATVSTLLPVLYLPAVGKNVFAERYLYLPSFGFAYLAALLAGLAVRGSLIRRSAAIALLLGVLGVFFAGTVDRNAVWKDDVSLWSDAAAKSPRDAVPLNALGVAFDASDRQDDAAEMYREAVAADPGMLDAHLNLGNYFNRTGRIDEAIEQYRLALAVKGGDAAAHNNLGVAYARSGRLSEAVDEFLAAISRDERYEEAYINLARVYRKLGMDEEEQKLLREKDRALARGPRRARIRETVIDRR